MEILGVNIYENDKKRLISDFSLLKKGYICVTSVHGLVSAYESKRINKAFEESFANVPDGMPIVYYSKLIKSKQLDRITGPIFIYDILEMINNQHKSLITVGSDEDTSIKFKTLLNERYPNIRYNAYDNSFINLENNTGFESVLNFCKNNKAEYLFVFLSTPKQDLLMNYLNSQINIKMIGFGAAIDYVTGKTKYAPKIIQKLSLEWLYRLIQEPKRLYKRYMKIIPLFFYYLLISSFSKNKQ